MDYNELSVNALRKRVSSRIRRGTLSQLGTHSAPSKAVRLMNKAILVNILETNKVDWNSSHIPKVNNSQIFKQNIEGDGSGDGANKDNDADNDTEGDSDSDTEGDNEKDSDTEGEGTTTQSIEIQVPVVSDPMAHSYVTTNGVVDAKQIINDINLKSLVDDVNKNMNTLSRRVNNSGGGGSSEIVIIANNKEVKRIKGEHHHPKFKTIVNYSLWHKNVFLVGEAGTGKTTVAGQVAKSLDLNFAHLSCSAGMSEAHILGRMLFDGTYVPSDFVNIYENGGVFLLDEFDAMDGNTAVVINSALANGCMSVPNRKDNPTALRHDDCIIIASANTWGNGYGSNQYAGRNRLDGATLDRFSASKIHFTYDKKLEKKLAGGHELLCDTLWELRKRVSSYSLNRIISTRLFKAGNIALSNDESLSDFISTITVDWTEEEKRKVDIKNIKKGNIQCD